MPFDWPKIWLTVWVTRINYFFLKKKLKLKLKIEWKLEKIFWILILLCVCSILSISMHQHKYKQIAHHPIQNLKKKINKHFFFQNLKYFKKLPKFESMCQWLDRDTVLQQLCPIKQTILSTQFCTNKCKRLLHWHDIQQHRRHVSPLLCLTTYHRIVYILVFF